MEALNGFKVVREILSGREVICALPEKSNGKWALKTEYFGEFPAVETELLKHGYHIFHIKNKTRWYHESDNKARAELARYVHEKYGLSRKCVIIGMSCGGMQGIYFAADYPEYVSCMYLDAPVVNFLSCPMGLGIGERECYDEFVEATGLDIPKLISYRNHPFDKLPKLTEHNIPVILVNGDCDTSVPFEENGYLIEEAYKKKGRIIQTIIKQGCGHHPHCLEDNTPIIDFIIGHDL